MKSAIVKTCCLIFLFTMATINYASAHKESKSATAYFAAGCFWCAEHDFANIPGVINVISGFTGGKVKNPTYEKVTQGKTGHFEAIKVTYDPAKVTFEDLLSIFWQNIDPTDPTGQFCDKGAQYQAVIFYQTKKEQKLAELSKSKLLASGKFKNITTLILPTSTFYPAEEYHQHYAEKNPLRYKFYRYLCGRDQRLKELSDLIK